MVTKTTKQLEEQYEIKALAYCWLLPELGLEEQYAGMIARRRAALAESDNPIVRQALETIDGGNKTLAAVVAEGGPVADLLDQARGYPMPAAVEKARKAPAEELLAKATGRDPVMVATFSHFGGNYPEADHTHDCSYVSKAKVGAGGYVASLSKVRMKRARPAMIGGSYFDACPACRHEAIMRDCQHIERISLNYADLAGLRYFKAPIDDRDKTGAKIRKHNQRNDIAVAYATVPAGDQVIVLHDDPAWLGGKALPADRPGLYDLVGRWHDAANNGQRSRGLASWGWGVNLEPEEEPEPETGQGGNQDRATKCTVTFEHGSYGRLLMVLCGLYEDITAGEKATRFRPKQIHLQELIDIAEASGIKYTIKGDLPANVTLNAIDNKKDCIKRDIGGTNGKNTEPRPISAALFGGAA